MERRQLGSTDLELTAVGVGTAPIGSGRDWPAWWGPQDGAASIRAIRRALDVGINWIDTAPFYGWGRAEDILARALEGRRGEVLVFTKCGTLRAETGSRMDLSPGSVSQPAVAGAIVGIRGEGEADQLPGAADLPLSETELEEIESATP